MPLQPQVRDHPERTTAVVLEGAIEPRTDKLGDFGDADSVLGKLGGSAVLRHESSLPWRFDCPAGVVLPNVLNRVLAWDSVENSETRHCCPGTPEATAASNLDALTLGALQHFMKRLVESSSVGRKREVRPPDPAAFPPERIGLSPLQIHAEVRFLAARQSSIQATSADHESRGKAKHPRCVRLPGCFHLASLTFIA